MNRKGIILAGGSGTRLYPLTKTISKQLLPIYDKPMIYYPLSTLMLADIRDILIISSPKDIESYNFLLGDGSDFGININYAIQPTPDGLAQAFLIGKEFIGNSNSCLILGDNLFYGNSMQQLLKKAAESKKGATVFVYHVNDPERYGVAELDGNKVISIEEKPLKPKSNYAVTGLYFYDNNVINYAKDIKPSKRGELEISDLNSLYLKNDNLFVEKLGRGYTWLDTGTPSSLLDASHFVQTIESRQNLKVSCPEEIAYQKSWITNEQLLKQANEIKNSNYGQYLFNIIKRPNK
jgi:glucose-1-phosphate thymidylyltransferase